YNTDGNILAAPIYDLAEDFEGPVARISRNNLFGLIDKRGREIVPPIYHQIDKFYNGFATVRKEDKYGMIDQEGNLVKELIYDEPITLTLQDKSWEKKKNQK
ncbi:MAG: WG repeat-containing protein, partial [Bacteroidota bacterium]